MQNLSRRCILRAGGVAAAALAGAAAGLPLRAGTAFAARTDIGTSVFPFPLGAVQLLTSPFSANTGRTHSYLNFLDPERMLHTFRLNVALSSTASAMGGWESPTTELRGHSMGHLLSALAKAYASTGTTAFKTKGDYLVAQLATCQSRATTAGYNTGYLSAYPESFIDRGEARQSVWAPYYTLHKIMAGLLDQHLLTGNAQALTVLTGMASWVKFRNDRLTQTQRQNMLDTEFGGMNEVLANLYQLTGTAAHLTTAQYFDHAEVFDPLASNVDALSNYHANTQIPKMLGAIREYHATGTTRYRDIAFNFWDIVTRRHSYAIGGNSNGEYFKAPDRIASELSDSTCESCNVYNMLKLTRQLFFTNPARADLMDFYEKAIYNQTLASQDPSSTHGAQCYYIPLRPGGIKTYSNDYNNFTCCHGTGMESNTKYGDSIYFFSGDTLYVNLFIPSVLTWSAKGITLRQETSFPEAGSTRLTITGSGSFTLRVRIPGWTSGPQLRVNGAGGRRDAHPRQLRHHHPDVGQRRRGGPERAHAGDARVHSGQCHHPGGEGRPDRPGRRVRDEQPVHHAHPHAGLADRDVHPVAVHRDREHRGGDAAAVLQAAWAAVHGLLAGDLDRAAAGAARLVRVQRELGHECGRRQRQRAYRHPGRRGDLGRRADGERGEPERLFPVRLVALRSAGRRLRRHGRALGKTGHHRRLAAGVRLRQRDRDEHVPQPAQQRRHRPVRHHDRRLRR